MKNLKLIVRTIGLLILLILVVLAVVSDLDNIMSNLMVGILSVIGFVMATLGGVIIEKLNK